jgi:hypothetical protein
MTISFNSLGNLGRLGNQMFQYAALRGIAAKHGYDYCLPPVDLIGTHDQNCALSDANIFNTFKLPLVEQKVLNAPVVQEASFEFDTNLFNNCIDNSDLFGYFQTEKYFLHIKENIRKAFSFKDELYNNCLEQFSSEFGTTEVISIHVRRGDYINYTHHPIQNISYYEKSLSYFNNNLPVIVFSDDIEWCRNQQIFDNDRFILSEGNSTQVDLCLQTFCNYHIIANSSFSWWGAWLAKSKKVIAPKNWFGPPLTHNTKYLYPSSWIII